jgi:hypothetical protein
MSTNSYTAFVFSDGWWRRYDGLQPSDQFTSDFGVRDVSINGRMAHRLAPSNEEILCFDVLFDSTNCLSGFELRILDEDVAQMFMETMRDTATVTGGVWPRVWVSNAFHGNPRPESTELFCDLHLCRTDDGTWIILVGSELLVSKEQEGAGLNGIVGDLPERKGDMTH